MARLAVEPGELALEVAAQRRGQAVRDLVHRLGKAALFVTHDLREAFKLGTRVLTFDKVRLDPHEPDAYGATITYDLAGYNRTEEAPCAPALF